MYKWFQWGVNTAVVVMVGTFWIWPVAQGFLPYEDRTVPDETIALNDEITATLETMESTFAELYASQSHSTASPLELTYLPETRPTLANHDNYAASVESVVYITIQDVAGSVYNGTGSIVTDDGVILTNFHVIEGAEKVLVTTFNGEHYPAVAVVKTDELLDVAFIKIDADGLRPMPIGNSKAAAVGEETLVIGHAEVFLNTLSIGNIAGFRSYASKGVGTNMQITNPISSGNSGGAVLNTYGELIGIPTWSVEYDQNAVQVQNLNFAVPINEALAILN